MIDGHGGLVDGDSGWVEGDGSLVDGDRSLVDKDGCLVFCRDGGGEVILSDDDDDDDSGLVSSSKDHGDGRFVPACCILLQVLPLWHRIEYGFRARWQEHCLLRQPFLQVHDVP